MQGVEARQVGLQAYDVELRQVLGKGDVGVCGRGQVVQNGEAVGGIGFYRKLGILILLFDYIV